MTPAMDGTRQSRAAMPSQTIPANAPLPRVTGGQAKPATAIAIGSVIVSPTRTSSGPPGR